MKELLVTPGERIVSRTDLKGHITDANEAFIKYSEYSKEELIGVNHNIVRHPDMPKIAFRLLWVKLYHGMDINVFVKNRTKKGNYYWVYATASAIIDRRTGRSNGYISIRKTANRDAIEQIEAIYAVLLDIERTEGIEASKEKLREILILNGWNEGVKFKDLMSKMQAQGAILKI